MIECSQCGACCKEIPVAINNKIDPNTRAYYLARGCIIKNGVVFAQYPCPNLIYPDFVGGKYKCGIHATRPQLCKDFDGRAISHGRKYFVPDSCTMKRMGKK
jgi:Fe-S-cluster containining protein